MKERIELGTVAINEFGEPYAGGQYSSGAKVYGSEAMARAALSRAHDVSKYRFLPAFVEIDREPADDFIPGASR
jgi:hypothetical protein